MMKLFAWFLLVTLSLSTNIDDVEAKFRISYRQPQSSESVQTQLTEIVSGNSSYEQFIIQNHDTDLLCYLPNLTDPSVLSRITGEETEVSIQKTSEQLVQEVVPQLSNFIDTSKCIFISGLNEGYWTYAYCFGDKVIQFHGNQEALKIHGVHVPEYPAFVYVLGRFEGSESEEPRIGLQSTAESQKLRPEDFEVVEDPIKGQTGYQVPPKALKHVLDMGEICDLTQEPRTVEVFYRCDPHATSRTEIIYVSEVRTCKYRMIINVKGLCGIEEFVPVVDEKVLDIVCDDFNKGALNSPEEFVFPQPRQKRVELTDFSLTAAGDGFFWGRPKGKDSDDLYDTRSVVFYTDEIDNWHKFVQHFIRMFSNSMEFKIPSPDPNSVNGIVTWDDSFIGWYEVYDHLGIFRLVVKVKRESDRETKMLSLQAVDPYAMVDQDGDPVYTPEPPADRKLYQYEFFERGVPLEEVEGPETSIKYVTVTYSATPDAATDSSTETNIDTH